MASLYIRNFDDDDADRIRLAAAARQMNLATYITQLSQLHENIRTLADNALETDTRTKFVTLLMQKHLEALGLETVVA